MAALTFELSHIEVLFDFYFRSSYLLIDLALSFHDPFIENHYEMSLKASVSSCQSDKDCFETNVTQEFIVMCPAAEVFLFSRKIFGLIPSYRQSPPSKSRIQLLGEKETETPFQARPEFGALEVLHWVGQAWLQSGAFHV